MLALHCKVNGGESWLGESWRSFSSFVVSAYPGWFWDLSLKFAQLCKMQNYNQWLVSCGAHLKFRKRLKYIFKPSKIARFKSSKKAKLQPRSKLILLIILCRSIPATFKFV